MPLTTPAEVVLAAWLLVAGLALATAVAYEAGRSRERRVLEPIGDRLRRELAELRATTAEAHRLECAYSWRYRRLAADHDTLVRTTHDLMRRYAAVCPETAKPKPKQKALPAGPHGRQRSHHRGRT